MIRKEKILLNLHKSNPDRYPFLLQSSAGEKKGRQKSARYDILFAFPGERLILHPLGNISGIQEFNGNFLNKLDAWQKKLSKKQPETLPFCGGWFLYLGYETLRECENIKGLPLNQSSLPDACAVRIPAGIVYDRHTDEIHIFSEGGQDDYEREINHDLKNLLCAEPADSPVVLPENMEQPKEEDPLYYKNGVRKCLEYIYSGDVFQVNLSRKWTSLLNEEISAAAIYESLQKNNPAPFSGIAHFPEGDIISSSPERLIRVNKNSIETRPIAGTRPRNSETQSEEELKKELAESLKDRAEHMMLIDLERNDLGRICIPGTVEIDEFMSVESFEHVHHIISNIKGTLKESTSIKDIIRSVFPGGTITGCPKIRCMEIIAELEKEARGPYTGSMGYLGLDGRMDLNILIRTIVKEKNKITFRTGAGIVADSDPQSELEETRAKAKGLMLALNSVNTGESYSSK